MHQDKKFSRPGFETSPDLQLSQTNFTLISHRCDNHYSKRAPSPNSQIKLIENLKLLFSRAFKADHNVLTELPYDFSQLLKKFDTKNVTLGHNRWMCACHAEITGRGLQRKIQDQQEVPFSFKTCLPLSCVQNY